LKFKFSEDIDLLLKEIWLITSLENILELVVAKENLVLKIL
jgi:hypothetical protein